MSKSNFSRRDFIQQGLWLGAAGTLAGSGLLTGCGQSPEGQSSAAHTADRTAAALNNTPPQYGGVLRVGLLSGNQTGNLDAHKPVATGIQRGFALYSKLWEWSPEMTPQLALAEFAEPNKDATEWTIRLKKGLEFHHGKTISADDVIFSLSRLTDPKLASPYAALLYSVDRNSIKKRDNLTVTVRFKDNKGFVPLADTWTNFGGIVPTDYHPVSNPVGAGPYKFKSFTPGQRSTFTRFENYFKAGKPYADELEIIDFKDNVTRLLALQNGQIDLVGGVPADQYALLKAQNNIQIIESQTNGWLSFDMNITKPPFNDARVREAFRLLIDRNDLVKRALNGKGKIANDLYAPHDPSFNHAIAQRPYDLAKARKLLAEAGYAKGLNVELVTNPASNIQAALVLAEQAKKAGVIIKVKQVDLATFNGAQRNDWVFSTGGTLAESFLVTALHVDGPVSVANKTHFNHPQFNQLFYAALSEPDLAKRTALVHQVQQIQFDQGGLIIWSFPKVLDAVSQRVGGAQAEHTQFPTWRFENLWLKPA